MSTDNQLQVGIAGCFLVRYRFLAEKGVILSAYDARRNGDITEYIKAACFCPIILSILEAKMWCGKQIIEIFDGVYL